MTEIDEKYLTIALAPETMQAQSIAYVAFRKSLEKLRIVKDLGRGFSYPFGQNQAEHEILLFVQGWNEAIAWLVENEYL